MTTETKVLQNPITTSIVSYLTNDSDGVQGVSDDNPLPVSVVGDLEINATGLATESTLQNVDTSLNYIETNTGDMLIKQQVANVALASIDNKTPTLVSGRVPVDVGSLSVTVSNAQLEISNDIGNPIPVSGTVTANQGGTWDINNIGGTISLPSGASTSANQATIITSLNNIDTAVGAQADTAATSDTGTFSIIAFIKRSMQSWTSLLAKLPALLDNRVPVTSRDFAYDVAAGRVTGTSFVSIRGYNQSTSTTNEPVWAQSGTTYPTTTSAQTLTLSSSSAVDTSAGTGARTVLVTYVEWSTGNQVSTVYTLNGLTGVTITTNGKAINGIRVLTAGSGGSNAGTLYVGYGTVTLGVPASILSTVVIGKNNAQQAIYTVPTGKVLELMTYRFSASALTYIQLRTRSSNTAIQVVEFDIPLNGVASFESVAPSLFAAGTEVQFWMQTAAGAATGGIIASGFLRDA